MIIIRTCGRGESQFNRTCQASAVEQSIGLCINACKHTHTPIHIYRHVLVYVIHCRILNSQHNASLLWVYYARNDGSERGLIMGVVCLNHNRQWKIMTAVTISPFQITKLLNDMYWPTGLISIKALNNSFKRVITILRCNWVILIT